jgi:hypothetical protein
MALTATDVLAGPIASATASATPTTQQTYQQKLADWATRAIEAMRSKVTRQSTWSAANAIQDPYQRLQYILSQSPMHSDQYPLYQAFLGANPQPIDEGPGAPPPVTTPTGPTHEEQLTSARAKATQNAELYLRQQGLDPQQYMPLINSEFDRIQSNLLSSDDPSTAFGDNIASSVLQGEQNRQRNEFLRSVDAKFNPEFEREAVPSSLLDDAINNILGTQQQSALDYLNRGKARGIYNDVGYNAGVSAIGNDASMGRSDLSSLGSSVIDKYRGQLDTVRDKAYNAASGFELGGSQFSIDPYASEFGDVTNRANTNASGDLRNLLGGRNYFDFPSLTNAAGRAQGATNLRDTDVATALRERQRRNTLSRGLGSQGAF